MKLYQYPNCSTCRKAVKYLNDKGVEFSSINIVDHPPSKAELQAMLASYNGEIRKLFNTSGLVYRELNLKDSLPSMSANSAIDLLSTNGKLIKRPFLLNQNGQGVVGFKDTLWDEFI